MNADALMLAETSARPNVMVPWYLISCFAYYHLDRPILSDQIFDDLARRLLAAWPSIEHRHKHLISEDALRAGTLLISEEVYPEMAKSSAHSVLRALWSQQEPSRIELFYNQLLQTENQP